MEEQGAAKKVVPIRVKEAKKQQALQKKKANKEAKKKIFDSKMAVPVAARGKTTRWGLAKTTEDEDDMSVDESDLAVEAERKGITGPPIV